MSNLIDQLRSGDDLQEFYEIATKIRNQKLLTDAESNSLNRHKQEVEENEIKLLTETWRSSYWNNFARTLKSQSVYSTNACRFLNAINETIALPAYKYVNYHFSQLEKVFVILYNEPLSVAEILDHNDQHDATVNDNIIKAFLQVIYSYGLYPEDELKLSQVVCYLLKLQLSRLGQNMRTMLRKEISMSTRLYKYFVELMHPTMVYLTKALRKGVLDVIQLGNFWLDVDAKQSAARFLRDNNQNENRLPEYRALVVSKLVEFVDTFLESITEALPMLPPNLNWIIREIFCSLYEVVDNVTAVELSHACKDMIVSNLFCPAIISPQKYGIVDNDVRIGSIVNHNLVQIAMIIQMISLKEFEEPLEDYKEFLSQCRNTHLISQMMDEILLDQLTPDVQMISMFANGEAVSDLARKSSFVGTVADVNTVVQTINMCPSSSNQDIHRILYECKKLPPSFASATKKNQDGSEEDAAKFSALRSIHRKVQHSFKKNTTDSSKENVIQSDVSNSNFLEKDEFKLFYVDAAGKTYEPCVMFENISDKSGCEKKDTLQMPLPEKELESNSDISENEQKEKNMMIKKDEICIMNTEGSSTLQFPLSESKRSFSKLKTLGDKMRKGIIQSNTFTDLREHLIRTTSSAANSTGLITSNSEVTLSACCGPRDDILAKYAQTKVTNTVKPDPVLDNVLFFHSANSDEKQVEPYYSSTSVESCKAFVDTLRKIITVLGNVSYLPKIGCRKNMKNVSHNKKILLNWFLDGVLVESEHRRDYGQAAQLREVQRCIEIFEEKSVLILIDHMKSNYGIQEKIIDKMRLERIRLMRKSNDISSLEQRVLLNKKLTEQIIVDYLMRTFLETGFLQKTIGQQTPEVIAVLKFYDEFRQLVAHDERAELLNNLLVYLKTRLRNNTDWDYASDSMMDRAMTTMERYVLFSVYEIVFYPNPEIDKQRDKLLRDTIAKMSSVVTPSNEYLKIPNHLHNEAPWPSAQAELSMLDIYVTAQDKLNCVVRCCDVINNLVALSSKNAVASADDLTPVLVFVIIKANPRALLSNMKYIETYAGDKIETGKDAYYWTNFKAAVEYIKSLL